MLKKVLLIEDSPSMKKVAQMVLTPQIGFELKCVENEHQLLQALETYSPDVVVAWLYVMAEKSPIYFKKLRNICENILLLHDPADNLRPFLNEGLTEFLCKPFSGEDLCQAIHRVLKTIPTAEDAYHINQWQETMQAEIRQMVTVWLDKNLPELAKDVIREELAKLLEQP
jgi:DNA-binding NtrC family response regulator